MTVLTTPSIVIKKPDGLKSPLVVDQCVCDVEKVDMGRMSGPPGRRELKWKIATALCKVIMALVVLITLIASAVMVLKEPVRGNSLHRYQGYCTIPIDIKEEPQEQLIEPHFRRVMPLAWSSDPDVQVLGTADDPGSDALVQRALNEQLEIEDNVEKIRVFDNGKWITYYHDFDDNLTNIVDIDRCFLMDLDDQLVLSPEMFVTGIEHGDEFDVSRFRSTVRAVLPALQALSRLVAERCADKPTYKLMKINGDIIRKRSLDMPTPEYMQFAGKHVQEIDIDNLGEVLAFEKGHETA